MGVASFCGSRFLTGGTKDTTDSRNKDFKYARTIKLLKLKKKTGVLKVNQRDNKS
ncbi:hypothetical protein FEDK69T_00200 [Flavobacterium enshiense DK69]|nr:hypothetical protein FEDK69T_00200 [Flavobacterium enshiense DK69]